MQHILLVINALGEVFPPSLSYTQKTTIDQLVVSVIDNDVVIFHPASGSSTQAQEI